MNTKKYRYACYMKDDDKAYVNMYDSFKEMMYFAFKEMSRNPNARWDGFVRYKVNEEGVNVIDVIEVAGLGIK